MQKTMNSNKTRRECDYCGLECPATGLITCSNCQRRRYCSSHCKEVAWNYHRLRCLPSSKLTSADRLAVAAYDDLLPSDADVLRDYGFVRAQVPSSVVNLLGLFQGLIKFGGADPRTIHEQRLAGTLVENIKAYYEAIPVASRGSYYPWFVKNQHLLDSPAYQDDSSAAITDSSLKRAWRFTGGSTRDSPGRIKSRMRSWSERKRYCFQFIQFLLHPDFHLSPDRPEWIHFGFCRCNSSAEEADLWVAYCKLLEVTSFDHFFNAYDTSSLPALFSAHNLPITNPFILDVLRNSPQFYKSVWSLKQFVVGDYQGLVPSIIFDYGFYNCGDSEEAIHSLKLVYKTILTGAGANPLGLHQACIQGRLFENAQQATALDPKFAYLMKNPYPILFVDTASNPTYGAREKEHTYPWLWKMALLVLVAACIYKFLL